MGGAYIAHFAMYASLENHAHGEKRPCVCHPDFLYNYFVDTTLAALLAGWLPAALIAIHLFFLAPEAGAREPKAERDCRLRDAAGSEGRP